MLLFAWQVFVPLQPASVLLDRLRNLVRTSPDQLPIEAKPDLYVALCGELLGAADLFQYGYWEFTADPDDAVEEYRTWCRGTLVDAEEEDAEPEPDAFAFVTLLFLFEEGSRTDALLWEQVDAVEEGMEWERDVFIRFLETFPMLDFASVRSTVVFVRPGDGGDGVMGSTLREEHYHYLSPIL